MEIEEKAKMVARLEDALKIFQEFEEVIRSNKENVVRLTY